VQYLVGGHERRPELAQVLGLVDLVLRLFGLLQKHNNLSCRIRMKLITSLLYLRFTDVAQGRLKGIHAMGLFTVLALVSDTIASIITFTAVLTDITSHCSGWHYLCIEVQSGRNSIRHVNLLL
jgi:hypothetical protein